MKKILFLLIVTLFCRAHALPKADRKEIHNEEFTASVNL